MNEKNLYTSLTIILYTINAGIFALSALVLTVFKSRPTLFFPIEAYLAVAGIGSILAFAVFSKIRAITFRYMVSHEIIPSWTKVCKTMAALSAGLGIATIFVCLFIIRRHAGV